MQKAYTNLNIYLFDDLLMREGKVDMFFCAHGCCDVLSLVIELVATVLSACDQLRHGAMLEKQYPECLCVLMLMYTFKSQEKLDWKRLHFFHFWQPIQQNDNLHNVHTDPEPVICYFSFHMAKCHTSVSILSNIQLIHHKSMQILFCSFF